MKFSIWLFFTFVMMVSCTGSDADDLDNCTCDGDVETSTDGDNENVIDGDGDTDSIDNIEDVEEESCPESKCFIDGECIDAATKHNEYLCAVCDPDKDRFNWSAIADGTVCREGGFCDEAEACDGLSFRCPADRAAAYGESCDDGDDCTANDVCSGSGKGGENCKGITYHCSGHGSCNGDDYCNCDNGFGGDYCDQCADGHYLYPQCKNDLVCRVTKMYSGADCTGDSLMVEIIVKDSDEKEYITFYDMNGNSDCLEYYYDENGYLEATVINPYCANYDDFSHNEHCRLFINDNNGNVLTKGRDSNCDGNPDEDCYYYEWDINNNLKLESYSETCSANLVTNCNSYEYDADGNRISKNKDDNCDLTEEFCYEYTYENGLLTYETADVNCDESINSCYTTEYNQDGQQTAYENDYNCDTIVQNCEYRVYDDKGNLVLKGSDPGCGGTPTENCYYKAYDDRNNLISEYEDPSCSETQVEYCSSYTYNDNNQMIKGAYSDDCTEDKKSCYTVSHSCEEAFGFLEVE